MALSPKPISLVAATKSPTPGTKAQPFSVVGGLPAATASVAGGVKQGAAVVNATDATSVIAQLNALLVQLRATGVIAP